MAAFSPVLFDVSTRRYGDALPSDTMVAVTPRLALLMASATPCRVLLVLSMTTEPVGWLASWLKPPPSMLPPVPAVRPAAAGLLPAMVIGLPLAEVRVTLLAEA